MLVSFFMKRLYLFFLLPFFCFSQQVEVFYFDFDKAVLNQEEQIRFHEFSKQKDSIVIHQVFGYCDVRGDHPYNDILSDKRAGHLLELLQKNNFTFSEPLSIKGFGKRFDQNRIRSKNRKTEVWYSAIEKIKKIEKTEIITIPVNETFDKKEEPVEKPSLTELFDNARKGDTITLENIYFFFDSDKIKPESEPVLQELYYNLVSYPPLKIEIHAHICCNPDKKGIENLSQKRAKALYRYLTKSGISKKRLSYKHFGSTKPIYPIPEKNEKERQTNRRIEILITDK